MCLQTAQLKSYIHQAKKKTARTKINLDQRDAEYRNKTRSKSIEIQRKMD